MCGYKNSFPMKNMIIKIETAVKAAWSRLDMGKITPKPKNRRSEWKGIISELK